MKFILSFFGCIVLFGQSLVAKPLAGVNVNPSNLPVLMEWEKFTGRAADVIGDNFSADSWDVLLEAPTFREKGQKSAVAEQLRRWVDAFDGDGVLECGEGAKPYLGRPQAQLDEYVLELAIPIFPNRILNENDELVDSAQVADRWEMGNSNSRHHREAKRAFRALAAALVEAKMEKARLRLGWEFTGDWFPWSIDPKGGETAGTAAQFKACWKFIYLTMEEVNPDFQWVWCAHAGFDHYDPSDAFPSYPEDEFLDADDQRDKLLVDYVSTDIYDADGECYFRSEEAEDPALKLVPGYWNTRDEERKAAFEKFRQKVFEGRGPYAREGESQTVGMRYFQQLAQKHELPFAVSEWGPWANFVPARHAAPAESKWLRSAAFGGDDNPEFIAGFLSWMQANDAEYAILFEFYNGGEGDTVDHTLLPRYWNSEQEGRPRMSAYPEDSPWYRFKDQLHPQAARAYLQQLGSQ